MEKKERVPTEIDRIISVNERKVIEVVYSCNASGERPKVVKGFWSPEGEFLAENDPTKD